jgi:hypothetical protein
MLGMALAALAALAAVVGGAATSVTLCGEGFHTDAQASAKSCAAAVGEHVRGDYLRNLGGMSQTEYQLACCAENKCAPWTETFGTAGHSTHASLPLSDFLLHGYGCGGCLLGWRSHRPLPQQHKRAACPTQ